MPANEGEFIPVSAGLVFRGGKLLITQRRTKDHLGGLWEFPGGKQHEGETAEECLARELMEELAINVVVGELFDSIRHKYPERGVWLKFFLCKWAGGEPQKIGCQDFAWVTAGELANYSFPAADAQLLDKLVKSPNLWEQASDTNSSI